MSLSISGKWQGQFAYGSSYSAKLRDSIVNFLLECVETDGEIKGTCLDDKAKIVFEEPATISGFVENNFISFIKKYPSQWILNDDGTSIINKNTEAPDIHYTGIFHDEIFTGTWEMEITSQDESGSAIIQIFNGTWSMEKC